MYVLDTNVFIDAANAYYVFDLAPGYWDFLVQLFDSHHAVSIKSVYDELGEAGDGDPLKDWAKQYKQHFIAPDSRVVARYQQVMIWAKDNYEPPAVSEFQRVADSWIVAHALANGWVVVSQSFYDASRQGNEPRSVASSVSRGMCHGRWSVERKCGMGGTSSDSIEDNGGA